MKKYIYIFLYLYKHKHRYNYREGPLKVIPRLLSLVPELLQDAIFDGIEVVPNQPWGTLELPKSKEPPRRIRVEPIYFPLLSPRHREILATAAKKRRTVRAGLRHPGSLASEPSFRALMATFRDSILLGL